jgi:hypothetical protein
MPASDGYIDAVMIRDCPNADLLDLLLKMSNGMLFLSQQKHVNNYEYNLMNLQ